MVNKVVYCSLEAPSAGNGGFGDETLECFFSFLIFGFTQLTRFVSLACHANDEIKKI